MNKNLKLCPECKKRMLEYVERLSDPAIPDYHFMTVDELPRHPVVIKFPSEVTEND